MHDDWLKELRKSINRVDNQQKPSFCTEEATVTLLSLKMKGFKHLREALAYGRRIDNSAPPLDYDESEQVMDSQPDDPAMPMDNDSEHMMDSQPDDPTTPLDNDSQHSQPDDSELPMDETSGTDMNYEEPMSPVPGPSGLQVSITTTLFVL